MAKTLTRCLVLLVIVAAIGSGAAWYVYSGKAVTTAEHFMTGYNNAPLPGGGTIKVTYAKVERTAFPRTGARFIDPVVEFNAPGNGADQPAIRQLAKYTGATEVIIDYFTNRATFKSTGSGTMELQIGEEKHTATVDKADIEIMVKAKNRKAFEQWGIINYSNQNDVGEAVRNVAEFSINMGPMTVKDNDSGGMIYAQEALNAHLVNRTTTEKANADFTLVIRGSEVSEAYGTLTESLSKALGGPQIASAPDFQAFSVARAGKQDVDVDVSVNIPDTPMGKPMSNGSVIVRKLSMKNNFYTLQLPTQVILTEAGGVRKADVQLNWVVEVTPAAANEVAGSPNALEGFTPFIGQLAGQPEMANIDQEALNQKIIAALPTLSTLGPITFTLNGAIAVPDPENRDKTTVAESATLTKFNFSHKRWGLEAAGLASREQGKAPTVNFTVDCKQCDHLTRDIFLTANQAQDVLNFVAPARPQWDVSALMQERVNALLAEFGKKDATTGDIAFAITAPAAGDFRINDKPFAEVMMKVMALTAPATPPEQAPAAGTPAKKE